MFVSQLELVAFVKVSTLVRLGFSLGYRFVGGTAWVGPSDWDLAGGFGAIKLGVGRF